MERVERCEKRTWALTKQISVCGGNIILDLDFMKVKNRDLFVSLTGENYILIQLYYANAPAEIRRKVF